MRLNSHSHSEIDPSTSPMAAAMLLRILAADLEDTSLPPTPDDLVPPDDKIAAVTLFLFNGLELADLSARDTRYVKRLVARVPRPRARARRKQ